MNSPTHGLVLGGGHAGMLAATALARHLDTVTVVERDHYPEGPGHRKGAPQAHHGHLFVAGGVEAVESLLPGTVERLMAEGAHRMGLPEDSITLNAYGWQHRFPASHFMITCGRELLDWVIREQALRNDRITVVQGSDAGELTGDADRVTGAVITDAQGRERHVAADVVVDARGRGSRLKQWFAAQGREVEEEVLDLKLRYVTRVFAPPPRTMKEFHAVFNLFSDPTVPGPVSNAVMLPIEGDRWMLTASGVRGGEPPTDDEGFLAHLRRLAHPLLADLIDLAEPLTHAQTTRTTSNRRTYYERLDPWPEGLIVVGDALAAFNPIYGHGLSAAALGVVAMDRSLDDTGTGDGAARQAVRAVGAVADEPWQWATAQDIQYMDLEEDEANHLRSQMGAFVKMMMDAGPVQPVVSAALLNVHTLSAPQSTLQAPHVIAAVRRGARRPVLTGPPLTDAERAFLASHTKNGTAPGPGGA
ncbi:FAD-dependent oxidoreductase [Streptomyces sp. WMMC1477]|uniref:FAD-dependent oxidoreductase n=1 Tax=Streptomyces sp. WMMC1477 TaxID=3015155 RepID=UPI0022B738E7|nr:FAD-dependent monooxygenase [Streptomyces sp. WMMC1477]MCZ7434202.1 FAD-dependent oxidoreductase [Streptomyces sp. WMMC1477]